MGIRPPQRMLRVPRLARTLLRAWNELLSTLINTNLCAKSHPCRAGKRNNRRELHSVKLPPAPAWTSLIFVAAAELESKLALKQRAAKGTPAREARKHGSGSRCSPFQGWGCAWDHTPRVARLSGSRGQLVRDQPRALPPRPGVESPVSSDSQIPLGVPERVLRPGWVGDKSPRGNNPADLSTKALWRSPTDGPLRVTGVETGGRFGESTNWLF